jgi:hypothetical protein
MSKQPIRAEREYRARELKWHGRQLKLGSRLLATIEPDGTWDGMFRVRLPSGHVTDMVNLTRAKDAATSLALADLNRHARQARAAPPMRPNREAAE